MNKKLLAVAVASALALPGVALAQSSVTISGLFKVSFGELKIGQPLTGATAAGGALVARPAGVNTSEARVTDDSSRIIFNVVEDLGGGLQAIAQVDWRVAPDSGADGTAGSTFGAGGNNHLGLRSKTWGRIFVGQQDVHYYNRESDLTAKNDLKADSISILAYAGLGIQSIASASRTRNIIHYTTPNWGGFTLIAAYSTNPTPAAATGLTEADIGSPVRRGKGWNLNPNFAGPNWQIGYSYWNSKQDNPATSAAATCVVPASAACTAALVGALGSADQRSDRLYGSYTWGGFKVGLAWDKSKLKAAPTTLATPLAPGGTEISNRTAWSLPMQYVWGPHTIGGHYTKARDDKAAVFSGLSTGAKMFAIGYSYDLSKRTSAALTYARITNDANAAYNFFTSAGAAATSIGSASGNINLGEDPRLVSATLRHAF